MGRELVLAERNTEDPPAGSGAAAAEEVLAFRNVLYRAVLDLSAAFMASVAGGGSGAPLSRGHDDLEAAPLIKSHIATRWGLTRPANQAAAFGLVDRGVREGRIPRRIRVPR